MSKSKGDELEKKKKDKGKVKAEKTGSKTRTDWLDAHTDMPLVHDHAKRLESFLAAMADGKIEERELKEQESRVVALMKKVEPELDDDQHEAITNLLCELSAYNIMHTVFEIAQARPKTTFRG